MNQVIKVVNNSTNPLPTFAKEGDACVDLRVSFEESVPAGYNYTYNSDSRSIMVYPHGRVLVGTGLHISFDKNFLFKIMERSGIGSKGIKVNAGNIDSGYTGEIKISLSNLSERPFMIYEGDRIAQAALIPIERFTWDVVDKLDESDRGDSGFGASGLN